LTNLTIIVLHFAQKPAGTAFTEQTGPDDENLPERGHLF
jgi:hypothetical protein